MKMSKEVKHLIDIHRQFDRTALRFLKKITDPRFLHEDLFDHWREWRNEADRLREEISQLWLGILDQEGTEHQKRTEGRSVVFSLESMMLAIRDRVDFMRFIASTLERRKKR
jgi:hypothetical protein